MFTVAKDIFTEYIARRQSQHWLGEKGFFLNLFGKNLFIKKA